MIEFVNAKINIGLYITGQLSNGYHTLETIFYPVGIYAGTEINQTDFCDIIEISKIDNGCEKVICNVEGLKISFNFLGSRVNCDEDDNLICKATRIFFRYVREIKGVKISDDTNEGFEITLDKHLPYGAGMGGGSADASFMLKLLNKYFSKTIGFEPISDNELSTLALQLGADCPFFILNRPAFGSGIGENLEEIKLDLSGYYCLVVKPEIGISTREAFSGVIVGEANVDLREICKLPLCEWKELIRNDFERSLFPKYPELADIKMRHYELGAEYAQLSGSGSVVYGVYKEEYVAEQAFFAFNSTNKDVWLLKM